MTPQFWIGVILIAAGVLLRIVGMVTGREDVGADEGCLPIVLIVAGVIVLLDATGIK